LWTPAVFDDAFDVETPVDAVMEADALEVVALVDAMPEAGTFGSA